MADLHRVKGVGSESAALLEAAGVDSVVELARRDPAELTTAPKSVNEAKKLARRAPNESEVTQRVAHANEVPRLIEH